MTRALRAHRSRLVVTASQRERRSSPLARHPRRQERSGPLLADRCQVVHYRARTEAESRRLADADVGAAARAGFVVDDDLRWEQRGGRTGLVATYRYSPPASITRSLMTISVMAEGVAAVDAAEMATAGYVPWRRDWHGTSSGGPVGKVGGPMDAFGSTGQGWLIIEYRYAPERSSADLRAVALADARGRTGWWVLDDIEQSG